MTEERFRYVLSTPAQNSEEPRYVREKDPSFEEGTPGRNE